MSSTTSQWGARLPRGGVLAVAAVLVAMVTWQTTTLLATGGVDPSWVAALRLAHSAGVDFGSQFTWTYGPLGLLGFPVAVSSHTLLAAFAFAVVTQLALCYLLLRTASRAYPLLAAIALVYFVAALPLAHADVLLLIVFLYALSALDDPTTRAARWFPLAGGVLAALAALLKTNTGATALGIAVVASWALEGASGRRRLAVVPAAVLTFVVVWLATGNDLLDIPGWLVLSSSIVGGYSAAMQYEQTGLRWEYLAAAVLVVLLALAVAQHVRAYSRRRAVATILITAAFAFAYFKEGFVRHDVAHSPYFFAAMAVAFVSFTWRGQARWLAIGGVALAFTAVGISIGITLAPIASTRHVARQLADVASPGKRGKLVANSLAGERRAYGVSPQLLAELRGHTVHVDPLETAAISAYGLQWRPLPIVQSYSAYTSRLDEQNAHMLASAGAPQRLLRQNTQVLVDGRNRELEAPAAFRAILCNYRQVGFTQVWQVVAHTAPRCGAPRLLGSANAGSGEPISVPQAGGDEIVFARIHLSDSLLNKVVGPAYKPSTPTIVLGSGDPVPLVLATAADGIVLHVPPSAGFDPRFEGAADWKTIVVHPLTGRVAVDFFAARIDGQPSVPLGVRPSGALPSYTLEEVGGHEAVRGPDGTPAPVSPGGGFVDATFLVGNELDLGGWAADVGAGTPAPKILVFAAGKLVYAGAPNIERPDVAAAFARPALLHSGFAVILPRATVMAGPAPKNVRVFTLAGQRALEVQYLPGNPWRP